MPKLAEGRYSVKITLPKSCRSVRAQQYLECLTLLVKQKNQLIKEQNLLFLLSLEKVGAACGQRVPKPTVGPHSGGHEVKTPAVPMLFTAALRSGPVVGLLLSLCQEDSGRGVCTTSLSASGLVFCARRTERRHLKGLNSRCAHRWGQHRGALLQSLPLTEGGNLACLSRRPQLRTLN